MSTGGVTGIRSGAERGVRAQRHADAPVARSCVLETPLASKQRHRLPPGASPAPPVSAAGPRKPRRSRAAEERGARSRYCNILPLIAKSPSPAPDSWISGNAVIPSNNEMWILSSTPLGFQLREETREGQFLRLPKTDKKIPPRENGFRPRAYKKRAAPRGCLFSRALSGFSDHVWWLRGLQQVWRSRGGRWPVVKVTSTRS